jgi:hypothetical protein
MHKTILYESRLEATVGEEAKTIDGQTHRLDKKKR